MSGCNQGNRSSLCAVSDQAENVPLSPLISPLLPTEVVVSSCGEDEANTRSVCGPCSSLCDGRNFFSDTFQKIKDKLS
ncbi:uncharacterized protein LOC134966110 isoform X2 [Pseudophryne corroboree]|uniref:uncharacterized protein LOC134966110 isoform X2 n=1 Tax=Pseudophryne corroboree TaxID=495146 RepID=UPI003081E179